MAGLPEKASDRKEKTAAVQSSRAGTRNPKKASASALPKYVKDSLYQLYPHLSRETRLGLGLMINIPVFIKDPWIAQQNPLWGVGEVAVRVEHDIGDGPTSSRIAVVDFNADTQKLTEPVIWDTESGWFRIPPDGEWLTEISSKAANKEKIYREFADKAVNNPFFHQVNVWAVAQNVLEFFEDSQALGRRVLWGFDGNRLIVVPHAGYGDNAFYDRRSKSLQFYYFGDKEDQVYTCLSHDIITHETAHAVLDGIRPLYNELSSVQTAAFHEFVADLSTILLNLSNLGVRSIIARQLEGKLREAEFLANIAPQFGEAVEDQPYLRTAQNETKLQDVEGYLSPHHVSEVMTGAMFEILVKMQEKLSGEPSDGESTHISAQAPADAYPPEVKARIADQTLRDVADRFRRIAIQPLDLCPPCDIQFLDYAKAVFYNDVLANPFDEKGYRKVLLDVFHERGLCDCKYKPDKDLDEKCAFRTVLSAPALDLVPIDIGVISHSRLAVYNFLNDNRTQLRIPLHVNLCVVDVYENRKKGEADYRMPFETVLEYIWREKVTLEDAEPDLKFGEWEGKEVDLLCGGTIVYDERGNLLSWFYKPGTEHITPAREESLRQRSALWQSDPDEAKKMKVKKLTQLELSQLADLEQGRQRVTALLAYWSALIKGNLVGKPPSTDRFADGMKPVLAIEKDGVMGLEITPHLRRRDFDSEDAEWKIDY